MSDRVTQLEQKTESLEKRLATLESNFGSKSAEVPKVASSAPANLLSQLTPIK